MKSFNSLTLLLCYFDFLFLRTSRFSISGNNYIPAKRQWSKCSLYPKCLSPVVCKTKYSLNIVEYCGSKDHDEHRETKDFMSQIWSPSARYRFHFIGLADRGSVYTILLSLYLGLVPCLQENVLLCTEMVSLRIFCIHPAACEHCLRSITDGWEAPRIDTRFLIELIADSTVNTTLDWILATFREF